MQGQAARAIVVHFEPTLFHNSAAAFVKRRKGCGNAIAGHQVALVRFNHGGGFVVRICQIGDGAIGRFTVV